MNSDAYAEYVRKVVDQAPPLSESTRSLLAAIFRPVVSPTTVAAPMRSHDQARQAA